MEKIIIKIEPEWNGSHAYLEGVDYDLPGWATLPARFQSIWTTYKPFVNLSVNDVGEITDMAKGTEIGPDLNVTVTAKLSELSEACNNAIVNGCDVTLSNGKTGHIGLTAEDQINLTTAMAAVEQGAAGYPYHLDGELCAIFPAADILVMVQTATAHKLYHTTYYNHLAAWVRRCETAAEVQSIAYWDELPADLAKNLNDILSVVVANA